MRQTAESGRSERRDRNVNVQRNEIEEGEKVHTASLPALRGSWLVTGGGAACRRSLGVMDSPTGSSLEQATVAISLGTYHSTRAVRHDSDSVSIAERPRIDIKQPGSRRPSGERERLCVRSSGGNRNYRSVASEPLKRSSSSWDHKQKLEQRRSKELSSYVRRPTLYAFDTTYFPS
jgi:hypothetical protein